MAKSASSATCDVEACILLAYKSSASSLAISLIAASSSSEARRESAVPSLCGLGEASLSSIANA